MVLDVVCYGSAVSQHASDLLRKITAEQNHTWITHKGAYVLTNGDEAIRHSCMNVKDELYVFMIPLNAKLQY